MHATTSLQIALPHSSLDVLELPNGAREWGCCTRSALLIFCAYRLCLFMRMLLPQGHENTQELVHN